MTLGLMVAIHCHGNRAHVAIASHAKCRISNFLNFPGQEIATGNENDATQDTETPTVRFAHMPHVLELRIMLNMVKDYRNV